MIKSPKSVRSMIIMFSLVISQSVLAPPTSTGADSVIVEDTTMLQDVRIDIIYDNYPHPEGEIALWGFSCLIRNTPKTILFDTGEQGDSLMANMATMGIDPKTIEQVVISHDHHDHTGGLDGLIPECRKPRVFLLQSFSSGLKQRVKILGGEVVENSDAIEICPHVFTTGEMGNEITEQTLILQTRGGLIVITGCAHPGVVNIVKRAKEVLQGEILLVMGGFHLLRHSEEAIRQIMSELEELSVRYVAPTHCTGDMARQMFKETYGRRFIELGVGSTITLSDLLDER